MGVSAPRHTPLWREWLTREDSYFTVLLLVILSFVLAMTLPEGHVPRLITNLIEAITLVTAFRASRAPRPLFIASMVLFVVAAVIASLAAEGIGDSIALSQLIAAVLLAIVACTIGVQIFRLTIVDEHAIFGALCIYLLIGLFFSYMYAVIGAHGGGFFHNTAGTPRQRDYEYFSFVTLATLGFGDLVPGTDLARTLTVVEAMLGQLYLVTVVALLVSNYTQRRSRDG
jgi:hypothetical protein